MGVGDDEWSYRRSLQMQFQQTHHQWRNDNDEVSADAKILNRECLKREDIQAIKRSRLKKIGGRLRFISF